jgi:hypothetical protein
VQPIRSFIVRIYRRERRDIVGVVEDVRSGRATPFSSIASLWVALTRPGRTAPADASATPAAADEPSPRNEP